MSTPIDRPGTAPSATDVVDALPMAVVVADAEHRIRSWNHAAEVLYGHRRAEVAGESLLDVLFDVDDRATAAELLTTAASDAPWTGDRRVRRVDGMLLVSSFAAVPVGTDGAVAWIATDRIDQGLAEQERSILLSAEHAARETAEQALGLLEAILTSAPVGIAVFDLDLRYVRVNDAYASLSGVPAEQHVGGRVGDVVPLPSEVGADLRRVVTTGRTMLGRLVEIDDPRDPSVRRHFTVSYFPVRTSTGVLVGAGATVFEVTEAKRAEIERADLLLRAESAQRRLAILATASTVLTTTMDVDELLERLARVLTPSAADLAIIQLLGQTGRVEHTAVSHRHGDDVADVARYIRTRPVARDGSGPVATVLQTGEAQLIGRDALGDDLPLDVESGVIVPIETHGQTLGVLILATDGDRRLGDDDLDLAVEVAHRAALALGNARAFQQEHQIAGALQRALLPAVVPAVHGLDIAVRYVAATDGASIGGDWYDVIGLDDGTVGLVVGDVVGHDIAASSSMGQLRTALRVYACEDQSEPGTAVGRVDRLFDTLGLTYATCVLGIVDPAARWFRWSNAGHPPPLVVRDGAAWFLHDGAGVMLGVTAGAGTAEAEIELQPGDLLVLYTDGLVERRGESLSDGLDRLRRAATAADSGDADEVCDALLDALLPPRAERGDDVALLVVRMQREAPERTTHRIELVAAPDSAAVARGFVAGVLKGLGWRRHVETATLLVSELVTNAVQHGHPPYVLVVAVADDEVEVCVEDADSVIPEVHDVPTAFDPADLDESGRGFVLVRAMAQEWGIRPLLSGKATWFTLRDRDAD